MRYASSIKSPTLRQAYIKFLGDVDVGDQKDDLALLRAMCEVLVERHSDVDDPEQGVAKIQAITAMLLQIDKLIKSITEREIKQKYMVHIDSMKTMIGKMVEIINRHITDPDKVRRIAADITAIEMPAELPPGKD